MAANTLARHRLDIVVGLVPLAGIDAVPLHPLAVAIALFMENMVNRLVVVETLVMRVAVAVMNIASVVPLVVVLVVDVVRLPLLATRIQTFLPLGQSSLNGTIRLVRV